MIRTPSRTASRSLALFVPLALAAALVGCSSSDDDAAESTSTTSTTEAASESTRSDTTEDDTTDSDSASPTTTAEAVEDAAAEEICTTLKVLNEYDVQSAQIINAGDWTATQKFFVEQTQPVIAAYDRAIATGSDLSDELTQLRDITVGTGDLAASSSDLVEFGGKLAAQPGMIEAGQAGFTLNTFAESTCGFSTGGAGN